MLAYEFTLRSLVILGIGLWVIFGFIMAVMIGKYLKHRR